MWMVIAGLIAGIWVYTDSKGLVGRTFIQGSSRTLNPIGWGLLTAFFGIIALPFYLYKRSKYKQAHGIIEDPDAKYQTIGFVVGLVLVAGAAFYFGNQDLFKTDVRADVEASIRERFNEDEKLKKLQIVDFQIVHEGGNNYRGLLEVTDGKHFNKKIPVEVVHDGERLMWEFKQ